MRRDYRPKIARSMTSRLDIHYHFTPPEFIRQVRARANFDAARFSPADAAARTTSVMLDELERHQIDAAIASPPPPGAWFGNVVIARRLSRMWNEYAARIVHDHPSQFGFFALVTPPDRDGSLRELEYALDTLKADGVALVSNYDGQWLGDPKFDGFMGELDHRNAVVFVHPTALQASGLPLIANADLNPQMLEYPFDTTRTIVSILLAGIPKRYPNIRFIFAHGGGTIPYLAGRLSEIGLDGNPPRNDLYASLRTLYFDTARVANKISLTALVAVAGKNRIVFGSDAPFFSPSDEIKLMSTMKVAGQSLLETAHKNAVTLFSRFSPRDLSSAKR
ncbi:MAG: amidohydrolase family protein [Rhizobiales bacterium]|nr:amidohydrolase family protein [Hyphomicrobiales bacterium]